MNLANPKRSTGLSGRALWIWGMAFLIAGVVGKCVVQIGILKIPGLSGQQLFEKMEDPQVMGYATAALILEFLQCCAVPVFALLVAEGFAHTSDLKKYLLRVAALAVVTEIPYNLAMSGKWLDVSGRNPVFGVLLCLIMLYLYRHYGGKTAKNVAITALILVMAVLWASMLGIADGAVLCVLTSVLWFMRNKPQYRVFAGALVMVACCAVSPYYAVAPLAMLAIHFYNGEPYEGNRWVRYLAYPVLLLAIWGATVWFL